ncbi:MAG: vitamin K epoxide reductase family protein [Myxococcota bacterium]
MSRMFAVLFVLAAIAGLVFASLSTGDFVQHLDRQVHSIHCSFIPGVAPTTDAASGCHVALMSTWSSVFRSWVWGGLPVALPGMAVFAFLVFRGIELWAARGLKDRNASLFLFAVTLLPVFTSVFFAVIAIFELGTFCKTCAGIYTSSALCLVAAVGLVFSTWSAAEDNPDDDVNPTSEPVEFEHPAILWGVGLAELVAFVAIPVVLYFLVAPDHSRFVGTCGELPKPDDVNNVMIPLGEHRGPHDAIEVFDPLCPACRGFEDRLESSGLGEQLDRKAVLFPLDDKCNWMITQSIHPGACTVSEAILCADDDADAVIAWAFAHQEEIRAAAAEDADAAKKMVVKEFPRLKGCVGSANARQKLNRSLRWAVQNQLPVLTPQLYVEGRKLCDEDTDLGLDYALSRLIATGGGR